MESEREQMRVEMGEGEGAGCCLPCREAYLPVVFFKKKKEKKDISLWEQLFDSRQAVVTGKYIRPDLVCFGCFGDVAIMRERGLVIEQGQYDSFFSYSHPVVVLLCAFALFFYLFHFLTSFLLE